MNVHLIKTENMPVDKLKTLDKTEEAVVLGEIKGMELAKSIYDKKEDEQ